MLVKIPDVHGTFCNVAYHFVSSSMDTLQVDKGSTLKVSNEYSFYKKNIIVEDIVFELFLAKCNFLNKDTLIIASRVYYQGQIGLFLNANAIHTVRSTMDIHCEYPILEPEFIAINDKIITNSKVQHYHETIINHSVKFLSCNEIMHNFDCETSPLSMFHMYSFDNYFFHSLFDEYSHCDKINLEISKSSVNFNAYSSIMQREYNHLNSKCFPFQKYTRGHYWIQKNKELWTVQNEYYKPMIFTTPVWLLNHDGLKLNN